MSYITKIDLVRQVKSRSGSTATLSGSTIIKENLTVIGNFSGGTVSASTIYSGSTDLYDIFGESADTHVLPGTNINTGGTQSNPIINLNQNISVNSLSGTSITGTTISASTLSASTIFSASTNLYDIFAKTGGAATNVQGGKNISTGGTSSVPIINLDDNVNLPVLSATTLNSTNFTGITLSSTTISATTIYGNSSNPYFYKTAGGTFSEGVNGIDILNANLTTTGNVKGSNLSATTSIFSGSSNIDTLFQHMGLYKSIYIDAGAMVSNTSSGATSNTEEYTGTSLTTDNLMSDYFAFTGESREESVQFRIGFIDDWDLSTIKSKIYWDAAKNSSGKVVWGIKAGALSDNDALSGETIFGTSVNISDDLITYQDLHITSASTAITVGGSPALDDLIVFQITRKISDVGDTMTQDAKLLGCGIQYKQKLTGSTQW